MSKKVAVIMGSDSDLDTMRPCIQRLKSFGIPTEVHIISAHRTPAAAERFASQARENGSVRLSPQRAKPPIWPVCWPPIPPCPSSACPSRPL